MSLLHSFYCWGHVAVVAFTTVGFVLLGEERWPWLCFAWAIVPALNAVVLLFVPFFSLVEDGLAMRYKDLFRSGTFWLLVLLMLGAGASEQAMSQWASAYAQAGLGLSKTAGDLLGPMGFAVAMGLSRVLLGTRATVSNVRGIMQLSLAACIAHGPTPPPSTHDAGHSSPALHELGRLHSQRRAQPSQKRASTTSTARLSSRLVSSSRIDDSRVG